MAGEIYLSNLAGNFDYAQMLENIRAIKSQQIVFLQQRESQILAKKEAISSFGDILKDMQDSLDKISDITKLEKKAVFVSDESVLEANITDDLALSSSNIDITVNKLAQNDVWLTGSGLTDKTSPITSLVSSSLDISYGGNSITVNYDSTDSLESIVNKINAQAVDNNLNIKASIFYDGTNYRLLIKGLDTGADNTINITDNGNLISTLGGLNHAQTAQDAEISVYGVTVTSQTNRFDNVITGLSITAKAVSSSPVNITVQNDYTDFKEDLKGFIDKYNQMVDFITENTGKDGILSGEFSLQQIRSTIFKKLQPLMDKNLISVDKNTGHINLDTLQLDNLLSTDVSQVKTVVEDLKNNLYDYFIYATGTQSPVKLKEKSFDKQIDNIEERIELMTKRIDIEIETLKKQFISLQMLMAQMEDVKSRLSQSFGSINQGG
ncbi:MAG: flagellar filament capping protein FliD [Aquificae bacterium]|nr:flagellar filament capping protein FliD [Aquificota bacterium]